MTRQEIIEEYGVDSAGRIQAMGKFEGQMLYVPYFWDKYLDDCADRDDGRIIGFDLNRDDRTQFPELKRRRTLKIMQDDQGFIFEV